MKQFTAWQYLMIDVANQYGLDKLLFEERIQWTEENLDKLEELAETKGWWKERPLYIKAVQAVRKAQKGLPTGHLVGFDAVCSGVQIMSALTGCEAGGRITGLVDTGERPDAYTAVTDAMNEILSAQGLSVNVSRSDAKQATMTSYYGSKKTPKDIFGEKTPELEAFYQASSKVAPGAWELLHDLLHSWQPYAKFHAWQLPDGYDARVKVMQQKDVRIEVDELDHASFTYVYYENQGSKTGLSNIANVVHSVDAYLLRSVHRRCNYDEGSTRQAYALLLQERALRLVGMAQEKVLEDVDSMLAYYMNLWEKTRMADVVIVPYIQHSYEVCYLTDEHIDRLINVLEKMLTHRPFPVVTVHDEFKCHANHMNQLRYWYKEILAELSESTVLDYILSTIYQMPVNFQKMGTDLAAKIREANYALC